MRNYQSLLYNIIYIFLFFWYDGGCQQFISDEPVETYETIQINYFEAEAARDREFEKFRNKPIIPASAVPRNLFRSKKCSDRNAPIPQNKPTPSIPDFSSSVNLETDSNPTQQIENIPQKRLIDKRKMKAANVSSLMDFMRDIKIEDSAADENYLVLENSAAGKNSLVLENSATGGNSQCTSILDSFDSDSTDSDSENTDNSVNPLDSASSNEESLNINTEGLQSAQTISAVLGSVENNSLSIY